METLTGARRYPLPVALASRWSAQLALLSRGIREIYCVANRCDRGLSGEAGVMRWLPGDAFREWAMVARSRLTTGSRSRGGGARRGEAAHRGAVRESELLRERPIAAARRRDFGLQASVCRSWERSRSASTRGGRGPPPFVGAVPAPAGAAAEAIGPEAGGDGRTDLDPVPSEGQRKVAPGFGSKTGSESPHAGAARPWTHGRALPAHAGVRAPRRSTTGGSNPRLRPT